MRKRLLWAVLIAVGLAPAMGEAAETINLGYRESRLLPIPYDRAWKALVTAMDSYPTRKADPKRGVIESRPIEEKDHFDTFRYQITARLFQEEAGCRITLRVTRDMLLSDLSPSVAAPRTRWKSLGRYPRWERDILRRVERELGVPTVRDESVSPEVEARIKRLEGTLNLEDRLRRLEERLDGDGAPPSAPPPARAVPAPVGSPPLPEDLEALLTGTDVEGMKAQRHALIKQIQALDAQRQQWLEWIRHLDDRVLALELQE